MWSKYAKNNAQTNTIKTYDMILIIQLTARMGRQVWTMGYDQVMLNAEALKVQVA